jgi:polyisoprenyl-phosphate glycosyltransferase
MKKISIVTGCFNEEENVGILIHRIRDVMEKLPNYEYEHILIDNHSSDNTVAIIKSLSKEDKRIKLIVNARNFGAVRSGYHGLLQGKGDCVIALASDLQDPPELIPELLEKWEEGFKVALLVKPKSEELWAMSVVRKYYYKLVTSIAEVPLVRNTTGAGLYDQVVVEILRTIDDPYPYLRGLVSEIGFPIAKIPFVQPKRQQGITKNNFYSLYDIAMLGIIKHSKVPLRLMTMTGFCLSITSILVTLFFLSMKLLFWDSFTMGMAPLLLGIFFFASVQITMVGVLGEYIGSIHTHVRKLPLVVEQERVNFEESD